MNDREMAKAYSTALEVKAIMFSEVIEWADSIILRDQEPDIEIIEIAGSKKPSEAITNLNKYSLNADNNISNRLIFGIFYKALINSISSASMIARKLYFMAMYDPDLERFVELFSFWDSIDLAEDGIYGDPEEEKNKLLEFLRNEKA